MARQLKMINLNLSGKRALVWGASKGIGKACAEELAELGCEILAVARDEKALRSLIASLATPSQQQHRYLSLDLSDLTTLQNAITQAINHHCPIEIVINNIKILLFTIDSYVSYYLPYGIKLINSTSSL